MRTARTVLTPTRAAVWAAGLAAALAGCGGCSGGPAPDPARIAEGPDCPPASPDGVPGSAFALTVVESVDPSHAPVPHNRAEAVVFRLAYETLVDVDCDGTVVPGLAEHWSANPDSTEWTFRLREGAWFAHADVAGRRPVDATAVVAAWREMRQRSRRSGELRPSGWSVVRLRDAEAVDGRHLRIRTSAPVADLLARLSAPEFAVATRTREPEGHQALAWPQGTRGVIADPRVEAAARDFVWWPESKDGELRAARITVRVRPGHDPRDEAGDATDLLLTENLSAAELLRELPEFDVLALPWDCTYVLATPDSSIAAAIRDAVRGDLATDVLPVAARAVAAGPLTSAAPERSPAAGPPATRLRYAAGDDAARSLAERLSVTTIRGLGVSVVEWPGAVADYHPAEGDAGIVLGVPRRPGETLAEAVAARAPWVAEGAAFAPLVETRASLAVRTGFTGIRTGADGIPRLERAGWRTPRRRALP